MRFRIACLVAACGAAVAASPEERAVAYLSREVPRWFRENRCYSCHNNGDAARALFAAKHRSFAVPAEAIADTLLWLSRPAGWENNRGDPASSDKKLARLQFAAALAQAFRSGVSTGDRAPLRASAELLVAQQRDDGSFRLDDVAEPGSPITWGAALATYLGRDVLEVAGDRRFDPALAKAKRWLMNAPLDSVPDAAAILLGLRDADNGSAQSKRRACQDYLANAQGSDGGWGPYPKAPSEVFDSALALLALADSKMDASVARGRQWLIQAQLEEGGWPETTRPSGGRSYAQHISTSGWATLALIRTR
jgi:hypothetical protein